MKRKSSALVAAETVAVKAAKENVRLALENEILKHMLKEYCLEINHLRGVIREAVDYCERKMGRVKRNTEWLKEVTDG